MATFPNQVLLSDTHSENAELLVQVYRNDIRYATDSEVWFVWDKETNVWHTDRSGNSVKRLWIELADRADKQVPGPNGNLVKNPLRPKALNSQNVNGIVGLAASDRRITVRQADFDSRPRELNTPEGVISLESGELHTHKPSRLHTKTTSVAPKQVPTPMWERFLKRTFNGREDEISYIQALMGMAVVGEVTHQLFPFVIGPPGSGKSTFFEVTSQLLGDYAQGASTDLIMRTNSKHPTDMASLHGARMVFMSEVKQSDSLDEQRLKQLTGNDTITARYMRKDFFSFQPTHTLFMFGNFYPSISEVGEAVFRRLRVVPFDNQIKREDDDFVNDLKLQLLTEEGPGILKWIIDGAQRFFSDPLALMEPPRIKELTQQYKEDEDTMGQFLAECCLVEPNAQILSKELFEVYVDWCKDYGHHPMKANRLTRAIRDHPEGKDVYTDRTNKTRTIKGITIRPTIPRGTIPTTG